MLTVDRPDCFTVNGKDALGIIKDLMPGNNTLNTNYINVKKLKNIKLPA